MREPDMEVLHGYTKADVEGTMKFFEFTEADRVKRRNYWWGLAFNWFASLVLLGIMALTNPNPEHARFWVLLIGSLANFFYGFVWIYHLGYRVVLYRVLR